MKIIPCPFCGENKVELRIHEENGGWDGEITCPNCGIGFQSGWFGGGCDINYVEETTIKLWNSRTK